MHPRTLQRPPSPQIDIDQPAKPHIIRRTRITPVLRQTDIPALYRIGMNIIQFFPHHRFVKDHFGVNAFLPELILPVDLVRPFGKSQTL
jgi:hypothetical protein